MGAYPSMGATKGYYNQRTAFGGQFRLLRPQPRTSTTINIRSYNYNTGCGGGYGYGCGGFGYSWFPKAMGWLGIANTAVNMLGNLIGSFFPRQPQPTYYSQPIVNNNTKNSDNETIKKLLILDE